MVTGEEKERKRSRRSRSRERKRSRSRERKRTRRSRSRDRKRDRESKRDEGADQDFGEDGVPVVKEEDVDQYTGYGGYNPEDQNGGEEEEGAENEEYEGWRIAMEIFISLNRLFSQYDLSYFCTLWKICLLCRIMSLLVPTCCLTCFF